MAMRILWPRAATDSRQVELDAIGNGERPGPSPAPLARRASSLACGNYGGNAGLGRVNASIHECGHFPVILARHHDGCFAYQSCAEIARLRV